MPVSDEIRLLALQLLNAASFGAILFLLSSGLSLVMGVMGALNMAHGAIYMIGAYVGWTVAVQLGLPYFVAAVAATSAGALLGLFLERGFFVRLTGRPSDQILMSFGFVFILTTTTQLIWGALPKAPFSTPPLTGTIELGGVSYPVSRLALIAIALLIALVLVVVQNRTRLGAIVRAGMDDRDTARALGLPVALASTGVFVLGSAVAALGGFLGTPVLGAATSQAVDVLVLSLVVVIVGGVGSIVGSLLGSFVIALAITLGATFLGGNVGYMAAYVAMIVVLVLRPSGLLGRETRTA
jgi:branched-chain amino acid transport system permease protein